MEKPLVAIFSDSNFLSINLVENLLSKTCRVAVFSSDKKNWNSKTSHITNKTNFEIYDESEYFNFSQINYAIFLNGFTEKKNAFSNFKRIYQSPLFKNIKSLAIFPFETFDVKENLSLSLSPNLAVIYVGDLLGPRIDLESDLLVTSVLSESIQKRNLTLGVGEVFYPVFVSDAAKEIVKWVFSFGPYGRETFLLGSQVSGSTLWTEIKKIIPELTISYEKDFPVRSVPRGYDVKVVSSNLTFLIRETFSWISKSSVKIKPIAANRKVSKPRPNLRKLKITLSVMIPILVLPYLCLLLVTGLFYLSSKFYLSGKSETARNLLLISKTVSVVGRGESLVLKQIPLLGLIYKESFYALGLTQKVGEAAINGVYLVDNARFLFDKALGNEIYDPVKPSNEIKVYLDRIYQDVSLIQADTKDQATQNTFLAGEVMRKFDFEKAKRLTSEGVKIVDRLPEILGSSDPKTYLVLFQNNMELRPTGGFIGSFGLLTFEGGRMSDFTLSDVYSADGQLKGHIEPPAPIKNYLGEANWFLRDSNWDPDFPTSARRAEWFLDKEIDRQVDGTISLDLSPVKSLLNHTGPIHLADYDLDITPDNLYEKTQEEVHEDVFAGTHKKASFMTALSRNLVTEVSNLASGKKAQVLKEFYKNLEERHIQIYLHDEMVQSPVSSLGWSGEVATPSCGVGCQADLVGVIEANVGVNKANYFIKRSHSLKVDILPDRIEKELTLEIENSANQSLGLSGLYKAYIRVLVPQKSEVVGDYEIIESKGRKEIGFLTEVLGGETKRIVVSWSTPKEVGDSYGLYFRKQAGTGESDPLNVSIVAPDRAYSYNTTLSRDFLTKISWLKDK